MNEPVQVVVLGRPLELEPGKTYLLGLDGSRHMDAAAFKHVQKQLKAIKAMHNISFILLESPLKIVRDDLSDVVRLTVEATLQALRAAKRESEGRG